ncbi:helix-turn-helix transcriptional regulator [Chloroflexota bacterium]
METNRVKEYREKAGLTQVELARRARIASPNLSSIERGRLAAWPRIQRALAKALKCTKVELFPTENGGSDGE